MDWHEPGAACTCVVTEYHHHAGRDFFIDVDLFSMDELMEQATELLQSYRRFHLHAGEMTREDGVEEAKEQANVARDTFLAMFRGRLGDGDFLTEKTEKDVLSTMRSWLEQTYPKVGGRHAKGELQECSRLLMSLTSETAGAHGPAVWPYIKKIRIITERYLRECDEILAICNIGRATTDVGVASVFELARKAELSNVGIVCTKSDIKEQKRFELKRYLIETRNTSVSRKLHELYDNKIPAGALRVFCVSNTEYRAGRWLPRDDALPLLQLSGIIALRKHCLAIIGDSQLRIATKFVANDIPALLGDVGLWIESGAGSTSAEQKQIVRETLDKVEQMLHRVNTAVNPSLNMSAY
ncbi:uncharacterized protein ColSpa_04468 [Colletotrichum spaethianum]|uniref:Uncharacterized protein n=1 Tax=Colletotrichum spaethianum TaxID=700344 RepID=A0AA37NWG8_9PEZI|nr:uncharacterized protein ColSpa_04468 [Colletotrichum spaethianum]GKT44287.1 hypothetical protein ColSpa_04468 [Colletotrichum spaethianum]